jgi:hypothetical protein
LRNQEVAGLFEVAVLIGLAALEPRYTHAVFAQVKFTLFDAVCKIGG